MDRDREEVLLSLAASQARSFGSEAAASYFVGDVRRLRNSIEIMARRIEDLCAAPLMRHLIPAGT
jgi:hypothetical protein